MSLGEAFVTAHADTTEFLPDLKTKLNAVLRGFTQDIKVKADLSAFRDEIATATHDRAVEIHVRADLTGFREQLAGLTAREAISVPIVADTTFIRKQLASLQRRDAIVIPVIADLTFARKQLASLQRREAVSIPVIVDLAFARKQLESLRAKQAIEIPVVADTKFIRAQLDNLRATRAIEVPFRADLQFLRFQLATLSIGEAVKVPVKADLTFLRAQLTSLTVNEAIQVPVVADLKVLRGQLAALGTLGDAITLPLNASASSLVDFRAKIAAFFKADPLKIDIEAKLEPGNLRTLRTQAGRLASVTVKTDIDPVQFRAQLATASAKGVQVRITPLGIVAFRNEIAAFFKRLPALVAILPADLVAFRRKIQESARTTPIRVNVVPGNIQGFRDELRASLAAGAALGVDLKVGNKAEFRAEIRTLLEAHPGFPVNIRPVLNSGSATAAARAAAGSIENSFRGSANNIETFFRKSFNNIARNLKSFAGSFKSLASIGSASFLGVGEAAFIGIGAAGVKAASDVQLLNNTLKNLAVSTANTNFPLLSKNIDGSTQSFEALRDSIASFAFKSPLGVNDVTDAVIRLTSQLNVTGDQALDQLNAISGALAITPSGLTTEGLQGVVKALGQISSAGKLTGQELLQLSNRIPVLGKSEIFANIGQQIKDIDPQLKKLFGSVTDAGNLTDTKLQAVSSRVKELQKKGLIPANVALKAIFETLQKQPGAKNALDTFNKSLTGTIQRIKEQLKFKLGTLFLPILNDIADGIEKAGDALTNLFDSPGGKSFVNSFKDQFDAIVAAFIGALPKILSTIESIGKAFTVLITFLGSDKFAAFAKTVEGIFSEIGAIVGKAIDEIRKHSKEFGDLFNALKPVFAGVAEIVGGLFIGILNLVPVLTTIAKGIASLKPIVDIVVVAFVILTKILGAVFSNKFVQEIGAIVVSIITLGGVFGKIAETGAALRPILARVFQPLTAAFQGILGGVRTVLPFLGRMYAALARLYSAPLRAAIAALRSSISAIASAIRGVINSSINPLLAILRGAFGVARAAIGAVVDALSALARASAPIKAVFVGLGSAIANAFDSVRSAITGTIDNVLGVVQKILETLGKISVFGHDLIPGADAAARAIGNLRDQLNSIPSVTNAFVNVKINVTDAFSGNGGAPSGSATNLANEFNAEKQQRAQSVKDAADKAAADANKQGNDFGIKVSNSLLDGIKNSSTNSSKTKAAADKAASVAKTFADRIRSIADKLNEDLRKTLTTGTSTELRKALRSLARDIREAFIDTGKAPPSALLARIASDNKRLQKLADERDKIAKRLEAAMSRARDIASSAKDFANIAGLTLDDVTASVTKAGKASTSIDKATLDLAGSFQITRRKLNQTAKDVVDSNGNLTRALTGKDFLAVLKQRRDAIVKFNADIEALRKRGLSRTILDDLLSAGVEKGGQTAAQLRNSSGATIAAINATQQSIEKASKKLGDDAARIQDELNKRLEKAGEFAAAGFVTGLQKKENAIVKAITSIADKLIAAIRKRLQIKSPSKVTTALAEHTGHGIVIGLGNKAAAIAAQAAALADAAVPNFRPISLPDLTALAKVQSMDVMTNLKLAPVSKPKLDLEGIQRARLEVEANGGWTRNDVKDMKNVLSSIQGKRTEIHAPITQHVKTPTTAAKALRVAGIF